MTKVKHPKLNNPIEKHFNEITPYHYYFFALIFASKLPIFWHVLNLIFLSPPMNYYCNATNVDSSKDTRNVCPCDNPEWDKSVFTETIQTKFGLHCDRTWLISFSQSMAYFGSLMGSLLFGFLSDRYGRLSTFSICCLILGLSGILICVMPSIAAFTAMRFIEGIGVGGAIVIAYVFCIEFCGVRHRETVTALFHIPVNLSHITLSGISYLLRHCDQFQLAISIPLFFFVALQWLVVESPKWLMDNDYVDKAASVMEKISKFNKTSCEIIRQQIEEYHASKPTRRKLKFWQIFRHKKLSVNFACMAFIYFVCGMGYYGVSQYISQMSGNIHINVGISGFLLLPGTIAAIFLLKVFSRRTFLMGAIFLSGFFMIICILIPADLSLCKVIIACICNCFFFLAFIIVFLYGVELFPTTIRNSVLGVLSFLSRVGQMVAPPINALPDTAAGAIFGTLAIIGAVLCYPLPETKNTELPSSLEDSKTLPRKKVKLEEDTEIPTTTQT